MKKTFFFSALILALLFLTGCSLSLEDMGIPFIPTSTFTPLPPAPRTPTPTFPQKSAVSGGSLQTEILENEASLFTDTELGYQVVFSPEWLVVLVDSSVQEQLANAFGDQISEDILNLFNNASVQAGHRAIAIDYTYHYSQKTIASISLMYSPNPAVADTEMQEVLDSRVEAVPTRTPDAVVSYQVIQTNPNGLEYGKIVLNHPETETGISIKQVSAIFKISDGLLVMTGSTTEDDYLKLESIFQRAIDSVGIIN